MEVESVLVTGANRGIGLEFVKQLVELPKPPCFVFATYRNEDTLQALKAIQNAAKETQVILIKMDVTKKNDIENARKILESKLTVRGLTLLINNAGALKRQGFLDVTEENMEYHFATNTTGPIMVLKEMLPLLQISAARKSSGINVSAAAVLNMSSIAASIELTNEQPDHWLEIFSYRASKTALNMAMRVIALTLKDQGILIVNMYPGYVKTSMRSAKAQITTEESISDMLRTLSRLDESQHGAFIDRYGKTIPF